MIEYVNLLLLLTMFGATCCAYYRLKKIFYLISIVMDSEILDQLTSLEENVNSEVTKPKRGRRKKADPKVNEVEDSDVRDKRERLGPLKFGPPSRVAQAANHPVAILKKLPWGIVPGIVHYLFTFSDLRIKAFAKSDIFLLNLKEC